MADYFTKKDAEEFKEDIKRYLGILAEDFQHKLGFVIDGQLDIKREVEGLKDKVDKLEEKVDKLEEKVDNLEDKVDKLEEKVDKLEVKVDNVYNELIAHRDNTEIHAQQIKKKHK
jgi:predicted nuclease with TOPRIM domain